MIDSKNKTRLKEGEILLREGMLTFPVLPGEKPQLIASKCKKCGDLAFPGKERCGKCAGVEMEEVLLSSKGRIYSYTIVRQAVPGYRVPNILAVVKIPEDDTLMILAQIKDCNIEEVRCGLEVETVVAEVYTNRKGQQVIGYAFRPVKKGE